jgi:signal transduction histidine kinase
MIRILGCIVDAHDIRLVALAAVICAFGCYTTLTVLERARVGDQQRVSAPWLAAAALVAGASVWTTHFVAMLAFHASMPIAYDVLLTILSIVLAVLVSWLAFAFAHRFAAPTLGGALFGAAVGAMHYTGMAALSAPADAHWDWGYVAASILIGLVFGAAALRVFAGGVDLRRRLIATLLMTLAIAGHHFTAMTALALSPNPLIPVNTNSVLAPEWLAIVITCVMIVIIAFGLAASAVDHHLAKRAIAEAERLRLYVRELERTKRELEATTKDLHRAFEAAAAGSQAKSQFLATMSHELRTPLNAIIGFSETMAVEALGPLGNPRYKEYAELVRASGGHLLALINDILDFSKIDAGRLELQDEVLDVQEIVHETVKMTRGQADAAGVRVAEPSCGAIPLLRADRRRLRQILLNLLSNAIKFTPSGGEVRVTAAHREQGIAITVADTGIGMAADDIPKALERFGQIDSSLSRKYEGTGLGLPLSKRLVELHGGTLVIESAVGVGTRVTINLPADRNAADRAAA